MSGLVTEDSLATADPAADAARDTQAQCDEPAQVRLAAMNLLARREHSLKELRQKLGKRFGDESLIESELQRLADENLQSDERYAQSYLRQRSERGYGPLRIRQEMRERGLPDSAIAMAFEEVAPNWFDLAAAAFEKKFGTVPADKLKEKARRIRFMQYRGFTNEHFQYLLED